MQQPLKHTIATIMKALLLSLVLFSTSFATWKKIAVLPEPICCCFFLDPNHGFAGTGSYGLNLSLAIFVTNDGGITWSTATVPQGDGEVTQIIIRSDGVGFASIFSDQHPRMNLWKTTDGGYNWTDISSGDQFETGVSPDGNLVSFWTNPVQQNQNTNGIYIADGDTVITPGPNNSAFGEAWTAYCDTAHHIWYKLSEQSRVLDISTDGGKTWKKQHGFSSDLILGGLPVSIFGSEDKLYVQTERNGIIRSGIL